MIPSIDYLTLVIAGALLVYVGADEIDDKNPVWAQRAGLIISIIGIILFCTGTTRALMSALGW